MKKYLTLFLLGFLFSCSENTDDIDIAPQATLRMVKLETEPNLQKMLSNLSYGHERSVVNNNETSVFSKVNWSKATHYFDEERGIGFYTAPLSGNRNSDGYVENIMLWGNIEKPKGFVVRYEPVEGWFNRYNIAEDQKEFRGTIGYYDFEGRLIKESTILDDVGSPVDGRGTVALDCYNEDIEFIVAVQCDIDICTGEVVGCTVYTQTIHSTTCRSIPDGGGGGDGPSGDGPSGDPSGGGTGGGGPGGDGESILVPIDNEVPCAGDPVANPIINPAPGDSGTEGGTFGCTRVGIHTRCPEKVKPHDGLDIVALKDSPIYSMYSGTVSAVRSSLSSNEFSRSKPMGNYVQISSNINGLPIVIKYNHLNSVNVTLGQQVNQGDIIGTAGRTGNVSNDVSDHIHLQIQRTTDWEYLDPQDYMTTQFDENNEPIGGCQ